MDRYWVCIFTGTGKRVVLKVWGWEGVRSERPLCKGGELRVETDDKADSIARFYTYGCKFRSQVKIGSECKR